MNEYCKYKLTEKVKIHRELAGLQSIDDITLELVISKIFPKVCEFGRYQIKWKNDLPTELVKIPDEYEISVIRGQYYVMDKGSYLKQLYSSEFIDFNLLEHRESQLNRIL